MGCVFGPFLWSDWKLLWHVDIIQAIVAVMSLLFGNWFEPFWRDCALFNPAAWKGSSEDCTPPEAAANKVPAWGRPLQKPSREGWISVYVRLHFWPTGEWALLKKEDVLSSHWASGACEMGSLFVRDWGEFCQVEHMWLMKTDPCDLWQCSRLFGGCRLPLPLSLSRYLTFNRWILLHEFR